MRGGRHCALTLCHRTAQGKHNEVSCVVCCDVLYWKVCFAWKGKSLESPRAVQVGGCGSTQNRPCEHVRGTEHARVNYTSYCVTCAARLAVPVGTSSTKFRSLRSSLRLTLDGHVPYRGEKAGTWQSEIPHWWE